MLKRITKWSGIVVAASLIAGCITGPGGLAPSTIPITANDTYTVVKHDAIGVDTSFSILFIPVTPSCSAYQALMDAKEETGADALINVTGENKSVYLFIVNWQKMKIRGDAIKFQQAGSVLE
ncbi:MAG: hypothetical protein WCR55_00470 [Lentisphaerota bacterium]